MPVLELETVVKLYNWRSGRSAFCISAKGNTKTKEFGGNVNMERACRLLVVFAAMLVALFVVVVPAASAADSAKVAGEWNLTVESPNGTGTPSVTFKQDGETLTGTYKGRF